MVFTYRFLYNDMDVDDAENYTLRYTKRDRIEVTPFFQCSLLLPLAGSPRDESAVASIPRNAVET